MAPPTKRARTDKGKGRAMVEESVREEDESADEWADERAAQGGPQAEDDSDGIAQFEDDEDVGEMSEEYDEETELGKQLSSIPFGTLIKAQKKLARSSRAAQDDDDESEEESETSEFARNSRSKLERKGDSTAQTRRPNGSLRKAERSSKHAPMEMSSKRAVGRSRTIVETHTQKVRDPRFDALSGQFKPDLFRSSYAFLADAQTSELATLKKTAAAARKNVVLPQEEKDKIEAALTRMESREVARRTKEREGDALKDWKKAEEKKRGDGKKEFYLKKGDQKAVILQAKYDALSQDKKLLRKTVEKKRRKTGQQEKKLMPDKRKRE